MSQNHCYPCRARADRGNGVGNRILGVGRLEAAN